MMRDVVRALSELEQQLSQHYSITLNEAMILCCIGNDKISAGTICEHTGLLAPYASKILRGLENKHYLRRSFGHDDKRHIYFALTRQGSDVLDGLKQHPLTVPELFRPLLDAHCAGGNCTGAVATNTQS